jgi:DNA-binding CsgD family transcriptional regulator
VKDSRYLYAHRFGTSTADFMHCAVCNCQVFVRCEIEGQVYALVSAPTLLEFSRLQGFVPVDYDGENLPERLRRRARYWIPELYRGPLEDSPWRTFLILLRKHLDAHTVALLLRSPGDDEPMELLSEGGSRSDIENYNQGQFELDPLVELPSGQVVALHEFIPREELENSEFYRVIMQPQGWCDFLGADLREENELDIRIRIGRYQGGQEFGEEDKTLLRELLPHLETSVRLYTRMQRLERERAVYAGAVEQLSVATIILDEQAAVMSSNDLAQRLLARNDGITLRENQLQLASQEASRELHELVACVLKTSRQGDAPVVEAMRLPRAGGKPDLGLVIRGLPVPAAAQAQGIPRAAIFINDPGQVSAAPVKMLSRLFGFTPAEAGLAIQLANGLTLDEASAELGVSRNTTRTHLRSLFAKTGVSRQSMLVRLILKSVAPLGWETL